MKKVIIALLLTAAGCSMAQMPDFNPKQIDAYITPYYNSEGPQINVGKHSDGLKSSNEKTFLATIRSMKKNWAKLTAEEMYVGSIRLYDLGYRDESVYWFYAAQMRTRIFAGVVDPSKLGGLGSSAFELKQAQNAFYQLLGPYINGYALGDPDKFIAVLKRIQKEGAPDLNAIYPDVVFLPEAERATTTKEVLDGLGEFITYLQDPKQRQSLVQQRKENGTAEKFNKLENKPLPEI